MIRRPTSQWCRTRENHDRSLAETEVPARPATVTSAGWIAWVIMKTWEGLVLDVAVGVIALIGGFSLKFVVHTASSGWWFSLFTAHLEAVILVWVVRQVRRA